LPEQDANALAYRGKVFDRIRGKKVLFDLAFRGSKDRHTLEKKNDTNLLEMVMNHDSFVLYKYFFFIFPAKTRQFYFAKGHLHGRSLPRKRKHLLNQISFWCHLLILCLHPILAPINFVTLGSSSLIYSQWIHFVLQGILKGEVSLYC